MIRNIQKFVDQIKQAALQWLQDPCQTNAGSVNNTARESMRPAYFRKKVRKFEMRNY
jgi:hypothetical protein